MIIVGETIKAIWEKQVYCIWITRWNKKIWSEELGKDLKINENYFLIGGNSLNAIRIVGEIKNYLIIP